MARIVTLVVIIGQAALVAFQAQTGFVKVPDDQLARQEAIPAARLVFIAYGFVWLAVTTYVFLLWRRLGRVERELADVSGRLRDRGKTRP